MVWCSVVFGVVGCMMWCVWCSGVCGVWCGVRCVMWCDVVRCGVVWCSGVCSVVCCSRV